MRIIKGLILFALMTVGFAVQANTACQTAEKVVKDPAGLFEYKYLPCGSVEVKYVYDEPAVVLSKNDIRKGRSLKAGEEVMNIKPNGRSKGKIKMDQPGQILSFDSNKFMDGKTIKKGDVLFTYLPTFMHHDSVVNSGKDAKQKTIEKSWAESFLVKLKVETSYILDNLTKN